MKYNCKNCLSFDKEKSLCCFRDVLTIETNWCFNFHAPQEKITMSPIECYTKIYDYLHMCADKDCRDEIEDILHHLKKFLKSG